MSKSGPDYQLKVLIKKFEGKFAVLETDDKQNLLWPIKNLPDDAEAGRQVKLFISTTLSDQAEQEKLARAMLNQILSG
ncbi:MAG: hypothetical protein WCV50_06585 [Patescibacteria group bacterium]|jgi:hypothetical protein